MELGQWFSYIAGNLKEYWMEEKQFHYKVKELPNFLEKNKMKTEEVSDLLVAE